MQHFKALKTRTRFAISTIIGLCFALATFGCTTSKLVSGKNQVLDVNIGLRAEAVSEGIYLYFDNIPENADFLFFSLYDITTNDGLFIGTGFHGNDLERIKNTNFIICPFVKSGHEYKIEVTASIRTEENIKSINSHTITAVANGGIHILNNPILKWNNNNNIALLSERPVFSDEVINSQNAELNYRLVFFNEETSGGVSGGIGELTNELVYDNTQNFNSIIEMIGNISISGDISIYADVQLSLEYKDVIWILVFAKTGDSIY